MKILLSVIVTVVWAVLTIVVIDAACPCDKFSRFKVRLELNSRSKSKWQDCFPVQRAFKKNYTNHTDEEKAEAKENIATNCEKIQEHFLAFSLGLVTYKLKPMPFMDKNLTEVRDAKCGLVLPKDMRSLPAKDKKKKKKKAKKPRVEYPPAPPSRNWCYLHSPIRGEKSLLALRKL